MLLAHWPLTDALLRSVHKEDTTNRPDPSSLYETWHWQLTRHCLVSQSSCFNGPFLQAFQSSHKLVVALCRQNEIRTERLLI